MNRRVGVYPGTFDPIHQGHLAFCLEVIERGEVDEIILLPERMPRGKPNVTSLSERLVLLSEAIVPFPFMRATCLASDQFTVKETLPELNEAFKGATLSLLIGSDVVSSLGSWKGLDRLLDTMSLIIGMRQADAVGEIRAVVEQIGQTQGKSIRYSMIETAHADVASSRIRRGEMAVDFEMLRQRV
ncbi:MAG: Cytidyltransferase-related protein [Candidatus Saccharibacteria bacterium]|nr:Cytidyltransferase-related protein [Candidatus Saccharibacteria bacterium]